jgi:hypothetical protein
MIEEELSAETPTDADVVGLPRGESGEFTQPAVFTFEQVFLGSGTSGPSIQRATAVTRAAVTRGTDPGTLGRVDAIAAQMERTPFDLWHGNSATSS